MKLKNTTLAKMLLAAVPALLLALVLQPTAALAQATVDEITYKTDGNGYFLNGRDEQIDETWKYVEAGDLIPVPAVYAKDGFELVWWTVDKLTAFQEETFYPEDHIAVDKLKSLHLFDMAQNIVLIAHFKKPYIVSYESAGHGTVSQASEKVYEGDLPIAALTLTPDTDYEFGYWTANVDVELGDATSNAATSIKKGDPITDEQRKQIKVTSALTLTAHFTQTSVEPDNPDEPDSGSSTIKPADNSSSKLLPKTGDTLPGAMATVVLAGGATFVAGTVLLRKRCQ